MNTHAAPEGSPVPAADSPHMRVLTQYVKELSFRNPGGTIATDIQPTIDMGVEVKSRPMGDKGDAFEVDLCINVAAKRGEGMMFSVSLVYAGLFQFMNVRADDVEPLIWVECPRLLFPFARQIVADATRNGGFPPLMIDPIDFAQMFQQRMAEEQVKARVAAN